MLKKIFICLLFSWNLCHADPRYYLCGSNEDGCFDDQLQDCLCMPYDETNAANPYCLDFNNMSCEPLSKMPDCQTIFRDQGRCLATLFQSEPEPPCRTTSQSFCENNHILIYRENGKPK